MIKFTKLYNKFIYVLERIERWKSLIINDINITTIHILNILLIKYIYIHINTNYKNIYNYKLIGILYIIYIKCSI